MEESWDEDSEARLTAANIVSRLNDAMKELHEQENNTNNGSVNTVTNTNTTDPHGNSHKKVRVSSSFSGQPATVNFNNVSQRTRFSVGTTESPHNYIQRFHRRNSVCNDAVSQFLPYPARFDSVVTPLTESSDSAPRHNNDIVNNPTVNIDAATGQPSVAAANESPTPHEEYTNASTTTEEQSSIP